MNIFNFVVLYGRLWLFLIFFVFEVEKIMSNISDLDVSVSYYIFLIFFFIFKIILCC